jgi:glycosyltransferase involved in cell wall biosynthesis
MKVAFLSDVQPPSPTGLGMLIYRMLEKVDPEDYCLISTSPFPTNGPSEGYAQKLPGRHVRLPPGFRLTRGYRFGLARVREWLNFPLDVVDRARQIAALLKRENCDALVAFTGDVTHLPAGLRACNKAKAPFFAYIVDHYSYREWHTPAATFWARRLEAHVMKNATAVIVLNEALRDDLRTRFGVEAEVIHNSFDLSPYEHSPTCCEDNTVKIVFTGDIYDAHYDAFHNLLKAITMLGRSDVNLHVYTIRTAQELAAVGISGPVVLHRPLAAEQMPRVQMDADILFLPLAFNSPYPGVIRTSAPTKMGEYLAARRPVIAHAPPDSFVVRYFREHGCGLVVDRLEPSLLADQIARVLNDEELREQLAERAWERAQADFDIKAAREKFTRLLKLKERKGRNTALTTETSGSS